MPIVQWNDTLKQAFGGATLENFQVAAVDYLAWNAETMADLFDSFSDSAIVSDAKAAFQSAMNLTGGNALRLINGSVLTRIGVPRVQDLRFDIFPRLYDTVLDNLFGEDVSAAIQTMTSMAWEMIPKQFQDAIEDALTEAIQEAVSAAVESISDGAADAVSTFGYIGQIIGAVIKTIIGIVRLAKTIKNAAKKREEMVEMLKRLEAPKAKIFSPSYDLAVANIIRSRIVKDNTFPVAEFSWTALFLPPFDPDTLEITQLQSGYAISGDRYGYGLMPTYIIEEGGKKVLRPDPDRLWTIEVSEILSSMDSIRNTASLLPTVDFMSKGLMGHSAYNGFPSTLRVDWYGIRTEWARFAQALYAKMIELTDQVKGCGHCFPDHWYIRQWIASMFKVPMGKLGGISDGEPHPHKKPKITYPPTFESETDFDTWLEYGVFSGASDAGIQYQRDAIDSMNVAYMIQEEMKGLNPDPAFTSDVALAEKWKDRAKENKMRLLQDPDLRSVLCRLDRNNIRDPDYKQAVENALGIKPGQIAVGLGPCMQIAAAHPDVPLGNDAPNPPPKPKKVWTDQEAIERHWERQRESFMKKYGWRLAVAGVSAAGIYGVYSLLKRTGRFDRMMKR